MKKQEIKIQSTVYPDVQLSENEWYKHIAQEIYNIQRN